MSYELADYKEVPQRIADLKAIHPDARLRPANPDKPFEIVTVDGKTFVVYVAACYRDADDQLPGIGVAWEPFPGRTPYTRDSELMNAETSAWGRAIVAALRSESKSIASAQDVRNHQADQAAARPQTFTAKQAKTRIYGAFRDSGLDQEAAKKAAEAAWYLGESSISEQALNELIAGLELDAGRPFETA